MIQHSNFDYDYEHETSQDHIICVLSLFICG